MKTAAIICEFNPFHNGHAYLIETVRKELGFDNIICIMSGNYVQRGAPAICDKYTRAEWALMAGADLVLEIPPLFSTSSAREFASCAVQIAIATGITDGLVFGVEDELSIEDLFAEASKEDISDDEELKEKIRTGMTYPEALSEIVSASTRLAANNILAVEYLRALKKMNSKIEPFAVKRVGDSFSAETPGNFRYTSAKAIRSLVENASDCSAFVPSYVRKDLKNSVTPDAFTPYLSHALLTEPDYCVFHDVSREIAGRLWNRRNRIMSFTERIEDTKTRQYTYTRISRALLHIALGIRKDDFLNAKEHGYINYLRILGIKKGSLLPSLIKQNAVLPVIGRTAQYKDILGKDIVFDQLYYSLTCQKGEFDRSPVILDRDNIG